MQYAHLISNLGHTNIYTTHSSPTPRHWNIKTATPNQVCSATKYTGWLQPGGYLYKNKSTTAGYDVITVNTVSCVPGQLPEIYY